MACTSGEDDWRSSCGSLVQQWGLARRKNFHTDVNFVVGEGETAVFFSAHKIVLAFGSPVFEDMFYGQLAETKNPISIVDIDAETFEILLSESNVEFLQYNQYHPLNYSSGVRYFYAESITFLSFVPAAKAYFAAEKYMVDRLKTVAGNFICCTTVNEGQFWEIMQQEKFFHISAIMTKCLECFSMNSKTLLKSKLLLNLSQDVMKAIVDLDHLNVSEYELLSAVVRWGQGSSTAKTECKLKSLLTCIRFSNLSAKEFCTFDESYRDVIGSNDSLAILKHLCNPSKFKLPQWCSPKTEKRKAKYNTLNVNNYC